ncbi:hypothetical protein ACFL2A_06670 [Thermodesulfobacteriota bacterium]
MKHQKKIILILMLLITTISVFAYAEPTTPMSAISNDIPVEVRKHIRGLYSSSGEKRAIAAGKLGEMREKASLAMPFLIEMIDDTGWLYCDCATVLSPVSRALAKIGGEGAIEPLGLALMYGNVCDRDFIEGMLDEINKGWTKSEAFKKVLPELVKALHGEKGFHLRSGVADTLSRKIGWQPETIEEKIDFYIATSKWLKIPKIGKPAMKKLIMTLIFPLEYEKASITLDQIDAKWRESDEFKQTKPKFVSLLLDKKLERKKGIVYALENMGWKPSNEEEEINYLVAKNEWDKLVAIGEPAVELLIDELEKTWGYNKQQFIAKALGDIGDPKAIPVLISMSNGDFLQESCSEDSVYSYKRIKEAANKEIEKIKNKTP